MKLLVVTTSYPLFQNAISGIFVKRLNQALGVTLEVETVCPDANITERSSAHQPMVHVAKYAPKKYQLLAHHSGGIPVAIKQNRLFILLIPSMLLSMFVTTFKQLRKNDFLLCHWAINGLIGGLANYYYKKKSIVVFHGSDANSVASSSINRFIARVAIKLNDYTFGVSQEIVKTLRDQFPAYAQKIHFVPNGVDKAILDLPHIKTDEIVLTTIANLNPLKGVQDIIRAMAEVKDDRVILNVIGDGKMRSDLEDLAKRLNIEKRVNFKGVVAPQAIPNILSKSDVFVLASYSEGRPSVVLEAMAASSAILVSNLPGVTEFITDGDNGLVFEAGNIAEITSKIELCLNDPLLLLSLGEQARNYIKKNDLTWDRTATQYVEFYKSGVK